MKPELVSLCVFPLLASVVTSSAHEALQLQEAGLKIPGQTVLEADKVDGIQTKVAGQKESTTADYFPWTHKPVCTEHLDQIGDKLCVYTNATFSNGRGISIFTTPKIALEFGPLPAFQDSTALSSQGINPEPDRKDQPWYTSFISGKGIGMLATRALQRGDLITAYTPFLLMHLENILSTLERERFLKIAIDQLPAKSREEYLSLSKIYNDPSVVVQDVVKANAFEIQVGGLMHMAVFPESSRFNHACAPNAQYFLSPSLLTHYVHAVRSIAKDEEITIAYSPPLRLYADRQAYLQSTFQFKCTCPRCTAHTDALAHGNTNMNDLTPSDKATKDIIALQSAMGQWTANSTASVKKAEMLVRLYKQEGLDAFLDDAYGHSALMHNSMGSARGASMYARLAAEASWLKYGWEGGSEMVREWKELAVRPEGHSSWRKRKGGL